MLEVELSEKAGSQWPQFKTVFQRDNTGNFVGGSGQFSALLVATKTGDFVLWANQTTKTVLSEDEIENWI